MKFKLAFTAAAAALAMAAATAPAQAREMYVRGSLGAAGSWAGEATTESWYFSDSLSVRTVSEVSMGRGVGLDAAVGVQLAGNLYGEIAVGYQSGLPFESRTTFNSATSASTKTRSVRGDMLRLTPALMFTADVASLKPFARLGMVIAVPKVTDTADSSDDYERTIEEVELTGGPTIGLAGALGIEYSLGGKLAVAAEFNYQSMAFSPTEGKLVKSTVDGVDKLPSMTTREKEVQFVDTLNSNPSVTANAGSPDMDTSISIPFSNFGAAVSLVYKF